MRDSLKITVKYQFMRILLMQAAASGVAFVFGAVAFWYFTNINIAKQLLSCVFMLVNFMFLYSPSRRFADMDNKPYTPLKPSMIKGVLFGCMIAALNVIFAVIFRLLWIKFGTETGITGVLPTAYNAFFFFWSYPYNGIMNLSHGTFTFYTWIAMIIVPIAATTAGYIAGCRKFDLVEKIDSMMYEKDE